MRTHHLCTNQSPRAPIWLVQSWAIRIIIPFLLLAVSVNMANGQDPTGRPHARSKHTKPAARITKPLTVTLTIVTTPPQCEIFINGEDRGATGDDGKINIDNLALGSYSVEARKSGFDPAVSTFDAGPQQPTLVLTLNVSLATRIEEMDSLMASGKLDGPGNPNALGLLKSLTNDFPDRPELVKVRSTLYAALMKIAEQTAKATVTNWTRVSAEDVDRAQHAAAHAVGLVDLDRRARACDMYLEGVHDLKQLDRTGAVPATSGGSGADSRQNPAKSSPPNTQALSGILLKLENASQIDQTFAPARYQMGRVLMLSNKPGAAEQAFIGAIALEPSWTVAHLGLAASYCSEAKYPEAAQEYQHVVDLDPKSSMAYAAMGLARSESGETERGIKDIQKAMVLDPARALPHFNLGVIYSKSKKRKERSLAVGELTRAMELNKDNLEFQNSAAQEIIARLKGHGKK
ncbi:MAG TPA: hypothetical protein VJX67_05120 [Blastocatellia bacterium]|nr:hypothetical protein [Blastocatellia bacterium]